MKELLKNLIVVAMIQGLIGAPATITALSRIKLDSDDTHPNMPGENVRLTEETLPYYFPPELLYKSSIESSDCDGDGISILIELELITDSYPGETSWIISNSETDEGVVEGGGYADGNTLYTETRSVCSNKCYQFTLFDTYGDGLSLASVSNGGTYKIFYDNHLVKEGDGNFEYLESSNFFGGGCASMHPSTSILPSLSAAPSPTPTSSPTDTPSMSVVPSSSPTTPVPSCTPSSSSFPSSSPSSSPSAPRTEWWSADPLESLEGNPSSVSSVCVRPGGGWLASGSDDSTIKLWNTQNGGEVIQTIDGHDGYLPVNSLDFNVDGTKLVSCSDDYTVELWDFNSNYTLSLNNTFIGHLNYVNAVKFTPDGRFIASGSKNAIIKVWSIIDGGPPIYNLTGHTSAIRSLSFSPDGKILASASDDKTIKLWDTVNGWSMIGSYKEHTDSVRSLDFSLDGTQLASGSFDNTVRIWHFENSTLSPLRILRQSADVHSVKYSPDGQYLATGLDDNTINLWNRNDNYYLIQTLIGHTGTIRALDFSPDGKKITSGSNDKTIRIWGIACPPGNYGARQQCQPCPPGTYQPHPDKRSKDSCIPCAAGTFQTMAGATQCETCTQGTFQPFKGKTMCDECAVGGYCANKTSADSCDGGFTACPIGTFNNMTGSFDEISCIQCPPGTFSANKTALDVCFECPKGTYQDKKGESECILCNSTAYQNQTGQTNCKNCPPGTYPDLSRSSCVDCPKGTYSTGGFSECKKCDAGSIQSQTGQSTCKNCTSGTYSDQSRVTCIQCPYPLGSGEKSNKCPFCMVDFYLKTTNVKPESLIEDPANFCLPCPHYAYCDKNTTIETIRGVPSFWRDSYQTETFYKCNDIAGVCLGGTLCAKGHMGVRCEVCVNKKEFFDSSGGRCTKCPSFSRFGSLAAIVVGFWILFFIAKYIMHRYEKKIERFSRRVSYSLAKIGLQAKIKMLVSFYQVIITFQPIYGVYIHRAFTSWFKLLEIFNFGLFEIVGIPATCFGSLEMRLLIIAGWPYAFVILVICGTLAYMLSIDMRKLERKKAMTNFLSRSLHGIIIVFYFVLPSVCRQIFDARKCKSFVTNDFKGTSNSYLIADWSIKCENRDSNYEDIQHYFWALFVLWPIAVPIAALCLLLYIRPSVRSDSVTPLAQASRFLWFDYDRHMMFWEVIDMVRKISLTGLIIFIDTEEGSEKNLRLIIATGICISYGTILSRARPYRRKDDLELAILSNLLLTCCFLVGIIIHQCKEEDDGRENNSCMKLFGLSDSYEASALAVILTVAMLISFILFIFIQSVNEFNAPIVRLVSTNDSPHMMMPKGCKYHIFMSYVWASGQDKIHKIARMLELYLHEVKIWLDVDQLDDFRDLENAVAESAHFVLFYSEGIFNSISCRREVLKAMEDNKTITVLYEANYNLGNNVFIMKEKLRQSWHGDPNLTRIMNYIFAEDPIMWISDGIQFSFESIKMITARLLKSSPYYKTSPGLLERGLKIVSIKKPTEVMSPLYILYCDINGRAYKLAETLAKECKKNVQASEIDLSKSYLHDNEHYVMMVYLNEDTFCSDGDKLHESVKYAMDNSIKLVLVHEKDTERGACPFHEIILQTPEELKKAPYEIYKQDIAISLYTKEEYEYVSLCQLLRKIGANPVGSKMKWSFPKSFKS